jgi:cyclophilin family peptidyl-prolyl cis-trans isomerase
MKAFGDLKTEWNELREKLFALQVDYKNAQADARAPIAENFKKLHDEGEQLQAKLLKAAEAAYAADPKNVTVSEFLAAFASGLYNADRYAESLPLAEALIKGNYSNKRIYNLAGKAAFNLGDFDIAEKYLKTAQDASAIDLKAERFLTYIPAYKTLWKKEQETRAAEAKADDLPRVQLKTTKGDIVLELFENEAPNTVANFINLIEKGFYNGVAFHRVLAEFMAQGGDPQGNGTGGPGYDIPCECYQPNKRNHFRGSLSMAHRGKDTGGSQFFITFLPTANLDGSAVDPKNTGACHTVFGRVTRCAKTPPQRPTRSSRRKSSANAVIPTSRRKSATKSPPRPPPPKKRSRPKKRNRPTRRSSRLYVADPSRVGLRAVESPSNS